MFGCFENSLGRQARLENPGMDSNLGASSAWAFVGHLSRGDCKLTGDARTGPLLKLV